MNINYNLLNEILDDYRKEYSMARQHAEASHYYKENCKPAFMHFVSAYESCSKGEGQRNIYLSFECESCGHVSRRTIKAS